MKSFLDFFLEYRHNLGDGTPSQSILPNNSKNPNKVGIEKKKLHTVGDYKPKEKFMHSPGTTFSGQKLTMVLVDYNLEFQDGATKKIKNSPMALKMWTDPNTNSPMATVVQIKPIINK